MCTYVTETITIAGSGKGQAGWFPLTDAAVYYDHPVHAPAGHTLNIDFRNPAQGPGARVAVELTAESALELARAIHAALDAVPPGVLDAEATQAAESAQTAGSAQAARVGAAVT